MYLNGYPVRFSTTSDPVQIKPGLWLGELQSALAADLKAGDEIAVRGLNGGNVFLRVVLYAKEPARGHGRTGQTFARAFSCSRPFPQLRLGLRTWFDGPRQAGEKHEAHIKIMNPLPYAAPTIVDWKIADYWGNPLVVKSESITLAAHAVKEIVYPFTTDGDAHAYQVDVKTAPGRGIQAALCPPGRDDGAERLDEAGIPAQPARPAGCPVARAVRPAVGQHRRGAPSSWTPGRGTVRRWRAAECPPRYRPT